MKQYSSNWFLARAPNGDEWIGHVDLDAPSGQEWTFELVTQVPIDQLYANPFDKAPTITGLLDLQTPATLIKPFVLRIEPGKLGAAYVAMRTRLEGSVLGVLSGMAVDDPEQPLFASFSFESVAFRSWLAPSLSSLAANSLVDVAIATDHPLTGVGRVICRGGTKSGQDLWSRTMRSAAMFAIAFDTPQSLDSMSGYCFALDRLFCFLIGFRAKPPEFSLVASGSQTADIPLRLRLAGAQWIDREPPFWLDSVHSRMVGDIELPKLVETFLAGKDDFIAAFDAVEAARFFSNDLVAQFKTVMPILEPLLQKLFTTSVENSYLELEKSYWDWFGRVASTEHQEFSRKHLRIVNNKAPALTTLLERAISEVNSKGFFVPADMADRIKTRRGRIFHSSPQIHSSADALSFALEARAATFLLLLLTLSSLGLNISLLANRPEALRDFTMFFKRREQAPEAGATPITDV
jgi:hypothetical protein